MINTYKNEYQNFQTHFEEDTRPLEAERDSDGLFDKDRAKKMKTYLIALEVKSHALLS